MNFIVTASFLNEPTKIHWKDRRFLAGFVACVLAIFSLGLAFGWGVRYLADDSKDQIASLTEELRDANFRLNDAHGEHQRELNAVAARMAELQANSTRLNALGSRLAQMGQLEGGEFDFNQPIGLGGPEAPVSVNDTSLEDIQKTLQWLEHDMARKREQLSVMDAILRGQDLTDSVVPNLLPVEHGHVSSHYGHRSDPFTGKKTFHAGIDFSGRSGTQILSAADGIVVFSGWKNGYGNVVDVDHGGGLKTRYAHNRVNLVQVGKRVHAGEAIAEMGSTGRSTGTHLHFEVHRNGQAVNPRPFLANMKASKVIR